MSNELTGTIDKHIKNDILNREKTKKSPKKYKIKNKKQINIDV
jgi:hypothetical protein